MKIHFLIEGPPQPKLRHRRNGKTGHMYTPQKTIEAEQNVKAQYLEAGLPYFDKAPLHMRLIYYMPIPKSLSKRKRLQMEGTPHIIRPDTDNLTKLVKDALNGICYHDDSQVFDDHGTKYYSNNPRTEVTIWEE